MSKRNSRKILSGTVVSDKMEKAATVLIKRQMVHPVYGKIIRKGRKYCIHDENNECNEGDSVKIMETRPLSKRKRWRLCEIVEKAK